MAEQNTCAGLVKDQDRVEAIKGKMANSKNPLQDMLNMQEWLQDVLADKLPESNIKPSEIVNKGQMVDWVDGNFDAILDEYRELKTSIGGMSRGEKNASAVWKRWKSDHLDIQHERIVDMSEDDKMEMIMEVIDIYHFVLNIFLGMGMDAEDIYLMYMLKNYENYERYTKRDY